MGCITRLDRVTHYGLVQVVGWSPPTLEPQSCDGGWHRRETTCFDANETRGAPLCPLGVGWREAAILHCFLV
jgi:hypothetical protein